jgi:SAM-dependent methyltransferase
MTMTPWRGVAPTAPFDAALSGLATRLQLADGRTISLHPARWHRKPDRADRWLLSRCQGATIDLGCGPGRLVRALIDRGLVALGVDSSAHAIEHCADRGAPVVRSDLFGALPDEGNWCHVLLVDGNIGIGGDPLVLLRRAVALLGAGGSVLIETAAPRAGLWHGGGRLCAGADADTGPWFPWATVGLDALPALARSADLRLVATHRARRRYFAELVRT